MRVKRKTPKTLPPRTPQKDWGKILDFYVKGDGTVTDTARYFGVSVQAASKRATVERWVEQRARYQNNHDLSPKEGQVDAAIARHSDAIQLTYEARILVLKKFIERVKGSSYIPTARDCEIITRLERDLDSPGWAKSKEEKEATVAQITLAELLRQNAENRKPSVIDAEIEKPQPSDDTADFLLGPDDE